MAHARHRPGLLVCSTVAFVTLAACSAAPQHGQSSTTVPVRQTTIATTISTADAAVEAGYRAFWSAYLRAADPTDPTAVGLAQHATGAELAQVVKSFTDHFNRGEVIRGQLQLSPHVISVVGTSATVADCYLDATHVYDRASGVEKDAPQSATFKVSAALVLDGGTWKVSSISKEGQGCTPA
jgi:hypothetical protein